MSAILIRYSIVRALPISASLFIDTHQSILKGRDSARKLVEAITPSGILEVEGGLETALGVVVFVNFILVGMFIYFFSTAFVSNMNFEYMSLETDPSCPECCEDIRIAFEAEWALDDSGYWSSNPRWGFAGSMVSADLIIRWSFYD